MVAFKSALHISPSWSFRPGIFWIPQQFTYYSSCEDLLVQLTSFEHICSRHTSYCFYHLSINIILVLPLGTQVHCQLASGLLFPRRTSDKCCKRFDLYFSHENELHVCTYRLMTYVFVPRSTLALLCNPGVHFSVYKRMQCWGHIQLQLLGLSKSKHFSLAFAASLYYFKPILLKEPRRSSSERKKMNNCTKTRFVYLPISLPMWRRHLLGPERSKEFLLRN